MHRIVRIASTFAATLALVSAATSTILAQEATSATTTVILVRHAEKAAAPAADPPLTRAGETRARALLDAVRDAGVGAIITTQFERTRATAAPTASALGIAPEVVTASGRTHAQDVAAAIRKHAGQTVLVVGHSNTIPEIIGALGATVPPMCDAEYDNLYVVVLATTGPTKLIRTKFGERTSVGAACATMK